MITFEAIENDLFFKPMTTKFIFIFVYFLLSLPQSSSSAFRLAHKEHTRYHLEYYQTSFIILVNGSFNIKTTYWTDWEYTWNWQGHSFSNMPKNEFYYHAQLTVKTVKKLGAQASVERYYNITCLYELSK